MTADLWLILRVLKKVSEKIWGAYVFDRASQVAWVVKNLPAHAGVMRDAGSVPESWRSPGGRNGNPLQCSCRGNPMDRGAWQAMVHEPTWLKWLRMHVPRWLQEIPRSGRSSGGENGNPLQYPCQENPRERSLVGYSWWGHKESDTTKQLTLCNSSVFLESLFSFAILRILFWWNKSQFTWNEEVHCFGPAIIFVARWNLL